MKKFTHGAAHLHGASEFRPAQGHDGAHLRGTSGSDIIVCNA